MASKSPRRAELLRQIGVDFEWLVGNNYVQVDETVEQGEDPAQYAMRLAQEKALKCFQELRKEGLSIAPILAADTTVSIENEILCKPVDKNDAWKMLERLSGKCHQVYTAVVITNGQMTHQALNCSEVHFANLSHEEIECYLNTKESFDKAGAYGIQGLASLFIREIKGSYSGIMGLPLYETGILLREFGWRFF